MSLPNEVTSLLAGGAKKYEITRSLRFNDNDSAYLSRTPAGAGNRRTWTWSGWVKRGNLGLVATPLFSAGSSTSDDTAIMFNSSDQIYFNYYRTGGSDTGARRTTQLFRDPGAWYHIVAVVDTTQATAADRCKLYVNGIQITSFVTSTDAAQNTDCIVGGAVAHTVGKNAQRAEYFDGYMAEVHFIDGQALTPSSFGETDPVTGVWIPKRYTGTYGTNGFYLSFANNASTTTLGYDDGTGIAGSGAGSNDWTLNNFSVTAGVGNDSLTDTPTNNYATWNPLWEGRTNAPTNGNLDYGASSVGIATFGLTTGKWYWEVTSTGGTSTVALRSTSVSSNTTITTGTTKGLRFDADAGTFDFTSDGSSWTSIATGLTSGPYFPYVSTAASTTASLNAGQRAFAYTVPSGYSAINTANIPTPAILKGSKYMNIVTWTGTGATRSITGVGFQPDLVWSKSRSNAETHKLVDSTRGATKALSSETTGDEVTESGITSFDADGFTIDGATDTGYNTNTYTYVGWNWKKGVTPGFDIVTYTGNGSARTISHGLGAVPHFMIVKARTTASTDQGWPVYHRNNTSAPETDYLLLNSTAATADLDTIWNDTAPTSSVFSVGTNALVNTNNDTYLAYLWTEISGFSRFGSYTGNGSTDGPFVWCGLRPRLVLIKEASSTGSWVMLDSARSPVNPINNQNLWADLANATGGASAYLDLLSNGFKIRDTDSDKNTSSQTYIFAAFAENPFKYSLAR
jgi:hypothetical protein